MAISAPDKSHKCSGQNCHGTPCASAGPVTEIVERFIQILRLFQRVDSTRQQRLAAAPLSITRIRRWTLTCGHAPAYLLKNNSRRPKLSNVGWCDGKDRTPPSLQILGCSSLIKSRVNDPKVLASAYNNRGNAFTSEGRYGLAVRDYDESVKLDPHFAKPLNNRGVAHQKRGEYDYSIDDFDAAISVEPTYANAFANRAETYQKKAIFPTL